MFNFVIYKRERMGFQSENDDLQCFQESGELQTLENVNTWREEITRGKVAA
jgi:hypothetical protein